VTAPIGAGTPAGTVSFYDGASLLGTAALAGGQATFTTPALAGGWHTVTARYAGGGGFLASASGVGPSSPQTIVATPALAYPTGVAVDGSGDLFIADYGGRQVVRLRPDGTQTTVGSGLSRPQGVAVDGSGNVFIADFDTNRVVEVKADGS